MTTRYEQAKIRKPDQKKVNAALKKMVKSGEADSRVAAAGILINEAIGQRKIEALCNGE